MTKLVFYFLLRNNIRYEIIILLFLGVYLFIQNDSGQYGTTYVSILLPILYIVYFNVLSRHKNRINLLYKGHTVKDLKNDVIKSIVSLSIVFLPVAIIIDIFLLRSFYITLHHFITLAAFVLSTWAISINIEKREKESLQIITFKESIKVMLLGLAIVVLASIPLYSIYN